MPNIDRAALRRTHERWCDDCRTKACIVIQLLDALEECETNVSRSMDASIAYRQERDTLKAKLAASEARMMRLDECLGRVLFDVHQNGGILPTTPYRYRDVWPREDQPAEADPAQEAT